MFYPTILKPSARAVAKSLDKFDLGGVVSQKEA
jgi:hypothetical protein